LIALPAHGCINIHASLLPRWRGAAPVQRALLAGDEQVGVSIMRMEEGLDTGPYCARAAVDVGEKNATELSRELSEIGSRLLLESLPAITDGTACWAEQDEQRATYARKLGKHELALLPEDTVETNERRVRASSPQAPARCVLAGRSVTVLRARGQKGHSEGPKEKATGPLVFDCADGGLEILELKPDGKKAMSAQAFQAGLKTPQGM